MVIKIATPQIKNIIMIAVSLMVVGLILPLGLGLIAGAGSVLISSETVGNVTTNTYLSDLVDPAVLTVLTVLIPILAVIGIALYYIKTK